MHDNVLLNKDLTPFQEALPLCRYPNNWQPSPNVVWDIVWPYIFVLLPLKCIVSSLLYCYLSIMPLNPSYLFVRIPNLLCMLKYVNVKIRAPSRINHFMKYAPCPGTCKPGDRRLPGCCSVPVLLHRLLAGIRLRVPWNAFTPEKASLFFCLWSSKCS